MAVPLLRGVPSQAKSGAAVTEFSFELSPSGEGGQPGDLVVMQVNVISAEAKAELKEALEKVGEAGGPVAMTAIAPGEAGSVAPHTETHSYLVWGTPNILGRVKCKLVATSACTFDTILYYVQAGTFNPSSPFMAIGKWLVSTEAEKTGSPKTSSVTATAETLALAFLAGGLSGASETSKWTSTGWTQAAVSNKDIMAASKTVPSGQPGVVTYSKTAAKEVVSIVLLIAPPAGIEFTRTASESVTITESTVRVGGAVRSSADALAIAESAVQAEASVRASSEGVAVAEAAGRQAASTRAASESVAIAENATAARGATRTANESVMVTESSARVGAAVRSQSEGVTVTESAVRSYKAARASSESVSVTESAGAQRGTSRVSSESVTIAESSTTRVARAARPAAEGVNIAEASARAFHTSRTAFDSVAITETVTVETGTGGLPQPARIMVVTRRAATVTTSTRAATTVDVVIRRRTTVSSEAL